MKPLLSIIIPNYNEKENLENKVLDEVYSYLKNVDYEWEVLISDDGSSDGSTQMADEFSKKHKGFRVLFNKHGGKARAVFEGVKAAKGEIILFTDMDQSTPLKEISKLLPFYDKGYDVVFGSRGSSRDASLFRKILAVGFLTFRRILVLPGIVDTQCGFKSMRASVAKEVFPQLTIIKNAEAAKGWVVSAFDVELLFLSQKKGYKLKEVLIDWKDRDVSTNKSRNFIKESKDMLKQIVSVRTNDIMGKYNV